MSRKPTDSSGISFTALYTGAVWHRYGLSDNILATEQGRWLYHLMTPFESASKAIIGGNIRTFLLQRHLIMDHLIDQAIHDTGTTQVLEIACGMSPRGLRLRQQHPLVHMVEADLPDMAGRKAMRLLAAGRLAKVMAQRPGSLYLTESYYRPRQPLLNGTLKALGALLGTATRSQVSFHFQTDDEAQRHFLACGFDSATVHDPRAWYGTLPIPESRGEPMVRVIACSS
ncbi:class I SAM-dependent methyltransferase [Marinobacter sediminum]|uniref:class I SAM-dependent methyltransferase n=1 Tax=Marinobacter sediminum TaxID=256323 RepID=UPI00193A87B7|nr:class I SAM-dependent methyltransferase [Marinobacter sediminum]